MELLQCKKKPSGVIGKTNIIYYTVRDIYILTILNGGKEMKRTVLVLVAIILACGILATGCKKKTSDGLTIKSGVLQIGMEIGYPPMEYYAEDGKTPMGVDVDMGRAIAEKLGLKAEFIDVAWDGIFASVSTNRFDAIMSSVTITEARQQAHNFSKPYFVNTLAMVLLKDSDVTASDPSELGGLNVAFQADTTADFFMQDLEEEIGLRYSPRRYEKVMSCFDELRLRRVDAIITDLPVAIDYVSQANSPFIIVWENPEPEIFGICMRKGNDALTEAINKALDELFNDGTMSSISIRHLLGDDPVVKARQLW